MLRYCLKGIALILILMACNNTNKEATEAKYTFTGADGEVKLIVIAPGHFHASLLQKSGLSQVDDTVFVYAPDGVEVEQYLSNIDSYNNREENPTNWNEIVYKGDDFLDKFKINTEGNVVVLAGNNRDKTEYIITAIEAGKNVLSDKPLAINSEDFIILEEAYQIADLEGLYLYDMMTERYDLLNIIEKELIGNSDFFGTLQTGTPDDPAVYMESVHHFYKEVSGVPLIRPAWYYDVEQQGEGIADVTTHLIDQLFWKCFPDEAINYRNDIGYVAASHWPTEVTLDNYKLSTGSESFPDYLQKDVENSVLKVNANGTLNFEVKSHHAELKVLWNWQAPVGGGDSFSSVIKGTKAILKTLQSADHNFVKQLFVQKPEGMDEIEFSENLKNAIDKLQEKYSFISFTQTSNVGEYLINIPIENREGHESHFTYVAEKFFNYLVNRDMPEWEKENTITKYYITTKAVELVNE